MKYCLKVFENQSGRLTSLYNVFPFTYRRNQWNKCKEGLKFFVYTDESMIVSELREGRELWLCEYKGLEKSYSDYLETFSSFKHDSEITNLKLAIKKLPVFSKSYFLAESVKPIKQIDFSHLISPDGYLLSKTWPIYKLKGYNNELSNL